MPGLMEKEKDKKRDLLKKKVLFLIKISRKIFN